MRTSTRTGRSSAIACSRSTPQRHAQARAAWEARKDKFAADEEQLEDKLTELHFELEQAKAQLRQKDGEFARQRDALQAAVEAKEAAENSGLSRADWDRLLERCTEAEAARDKAKGEYGRAADELAEAQLAQLEATEALALARDESEAAEYALAAVQQLAYGE